MGREHSPVPRRPAQFFFFFACCHQVFTNPSEYELGLACKRQRGHEQCVRQVLVSHIADRACFFTEFPELCSRGSNPA